MKLLTVLAPILLTVQAFAQFEPSTNGYTRLTNPTDNVGIGTVMGEVPGAKLHVKGGGVLVKNSYQAGISKYNYNIAIGDANSRNVFSMLDTSFLGELKFIGSLKYIGFGNLSFKSSFGTISQEMDLRPYYLQTSGDFSLLTTIPSKLTLGTNKANIVIINKDGNVGIGTNSDTLTERLEVKGNMKLYGKLAVQGVCITTNSRWCDYVFEPDYKLSPLVEVEKYIRQHKHLPEIPNAEEVKDGYDLNTMDALLLKKIEELTLYVIQLEKEVQALKTGKK